MDLTEIITKFQDHITKCRKDLLNHCDTAESNNCKHELIITRQRIDDLFILRYRLEQLLSQAGYKNLCKLVCFNPDMMQKMEKFWIKNKGVTDSET